MGSIPSVLQGNNRIHRLAALNNAHWCDAVCRAHGLVTSFSNVAWLSSQRTPLYYPDAVTLDGDTSCESILSSIDTDHAGCSVKDSFANLDLNHYGFEVLFDAHWIYRPAELFIEPPQLVLNWIRIDSPAGLSLWEAAWSGMKKSALFPPALLSNEIAFFAGFDTYGQILAGAIANRTGSVVGLSNVFTIANTPADVAWRGSLIAIEDLWPNHGVVGYESGADLALAISLGFQSVGALRVWLHP